MTINPATLKTLAPGAYNSLVEWIKDGEPEASDSKIAQQIEYMSADEALDHILEWEGILGYTNFIKLAVRGIDAAEET